jgi:putative (di)nucleoside polyphosphate hydrolase
MWFPSRLTAMRNERALATMKKTPPDNANAADMPYRPCVGIMLINGAGRVWLGRRIPKWIGDRSAYIWQMPQGGIDRGEEPLMAAFRELHEETGVTSAEVIGEIPGWLSYDLPPSLLGIALKGRYRGQRQRWFAMRFTGEDSEIDIRPRRGLKAEFDAWRWAAMEEVPLGIVSFKQAIYDEVVRTFGPLARG